MEGQDYNSLRNRNVTPLTELDIPELLAEQVDAFTPEAMCVENEGKLALDLPEGRTVVAVDIGGDSLTASTVTVVDGRLNHDLIIDMSDVEGGQGYLDALEQVAEYSSKNNLAVGLSYAGPKEGNIILGGVNVPTFMDELNAKYAYDLSRVIPNLLAFDNDAVAGLRRGALETIWQYGRLTNVIYVINGSGLNTAFLIDGEMFSSESGHVEIVPQLNPHGQQKECGLFGAKFVCVEAIAGNKAGVEDIWRQQTGTVLDGRAIQEKWEEGNELAELLYDNSALVTAHLVAGSAQGMEIELNDGSTTIVGHGGTFKFPHYGDRMNQIVQANTGSNSPLLLTKDFSPNACLEGAALAAFTKI